MNIKDVRVKAIYHYLVESCSDNDIDELVMILREYTLNGSFIDFEKEDVRVRELTDNIYELLGF